MRTSHTGATPVAWLADQLTNRSWQRLPAGKGAHGLRMYSWALLPLEPDPVGVEHLLIRRNDTTGELAFYRAFSTQPVPLSTLVAVAGQRWRVEESFQTSKGLAGLDQHQPGPECWSNGTSATR